MWAIPWKSGHEGLKKVLVIDIIFIYVIPYSICNQFKQKFKLSAN